MKKTLLAICAVLVASFSMAAGRVDSVRYLTSTAGQNWFFSANGTMDWWQGSDRNPNGNYSKVQWDNMTFGGSFSVGKWINHNVALRLSYDINGANSYIRGRHINLSGIQFLYGNNPTPDANDYYNTHFMYHNLHADVMFSPVDFFQGYYNPNRVWTPVLYAGMGGACVTGHFFMTQTFLHNWAEPNNKESMNFEFSFQGGLINNFRMNEYVDFNLNFNWSAQRWTIDSWSGYEYGNGIIAGETPRPRRADFNYSVGLGMTYYIGGRIYELPYNYDKELREMQERIKNLENELANLPVAVEQAPCDTVVIYKDNIEAISYPFSIFFNRDSYQLMSKRDLVNLREIAEVAKANNFKLRLRGSCDSATASPAYNQKLSENRCRKIMLELLEMGFPEENIILEPVGGVKELDPTEFDRRVLIDLIKYHE